MPRIILFNKPFGVICQFTRVDGHQSLRDFIPLSDFYPAGRLDADSEGLVLLTDNGKLQNRICSPKFKLPKTYWVQVEGKPDDVALNALRRGVVLNDFKAQPAQVSLMDEPSFLWQRKPPIRFRKDIPTAWLSLVLKEGKNRQVRRMTAAVFFPTLRLIRYAIGLYTLQGIVPGEWRMLADSDIG
ncbi:pseudouridine synthase [Nitrosomonas sp.]|uniref:pseudouridine synthase n=1 Tax=Nitrosomonas sp. TaxID=42353 RepID=UPI0025E9FCE0|nr:pseudouridine synthase [Nitrosomonas sp.]